MVDAMGPKPVSSSDRTIAAVARVPAPASITPAAKEPSSPPPTAISSIARELAAKPPVDADRVRLIKAAIASGTFPILPATIADRLIALKYEWMADDQA